MDIFIQIMVVFCLIGLLDKLLGNRFGLAPSFDRGIDAVGGLALSMMGFYCVATTFFRNNMVAINNLALKFHLEPSIIGSSFLAPDMGGYNIASALTTNENLVIVGGLLVTSSIGCVISWTLPVFLAALKDESLTDFIKGLLYGIIVLPIVMIPLCIYLQVNPMVLLPVFIICAILLACLVFLAKETIKVLDKFGQFIKIVSYILFGMVITQLYFPSFAYVPFDLVQEAMIVVLKCGIIMSGSLVLSDLILSLFSRQIKHFSRMVGLDPYSIIGLILSCATAVAIIPFFDKMDKRGRIMNGAFNVAGAYFAGAQLGFVSGASSAKGVLFYLIFKVAAGILAILAAYIFEPKDKKLNAEMN